MYTPSFVAIMCASVIVLAALAALIYMLVKPKKNTSKVTQNSLANELQKTQRRNWQIWILYFVIALIIAYWTIWGALFFLAVVWVLRTNPGSDASLTISDNEKKTARRVYTWLFFSPLLTIPLLITLLLNSSYESTPPLNQIFLTVLTSSFLHAFLLIGLTSKSVFVYRHTQQGILLISLRAGMASLAVVNLDSHFDNALTLFFLGNGLLWLFGSIIGWNQISNGKCWFMDRKGETPIISSNGIPNLPAQKHIEQSQTFIHTYKPDEAKKHVLAAFRNGDREIKSQAVKLLRTLDEVEKF